MSNDHQRVADRFPEGVPPDDALPTTTVQEHYRRAAPALKAIATVGDHPTIGLNDHRGWYVKRDTDDVELLEASFDRQGRVATLDRDLETIIDRVERCLYAVTTYKDAAAIRTERPCTYDPDEGTTVWQNGEDPMPGYGDLRAVPAWGDVDLRDAIKPERGALDAATRETIEATLEAYVDEFATLYGGRDAVSALDSVGGAYVFGAPEATLPIAEHFDDADARGRVMEAFIDRSNEWLRNAQQRVETQVDEAADVMDPDWVNNKNRQYKAPLSLHADHDAVVTPLDTGDVQYEYTPLDAVDEDLIAAATDWGERFTAVEHTDRVRTVVGQLWPDYVDEYGDWQDALDAWVADEREAEQRRREAKQRRAERKASLDGDLEGQPITPFLQDIYDAIDAIDTADVVKRHAADTWDTGRSTGDVTEFNPSWRSSASGSSCYVDHAANTFGDPGQGGGGFAAKAIALGEGNIVDASDDLDGAEWWDAVDALRDAGYAVPVYTPEQGSARPSGEAYDEMPFWAVRHAAVALGVCPPEAFTEKEADDGDTYRGFPGPETYNNALEAVEDAGLEHGREYADTDPGFRPKQIAARAGAETVTDLNDRERAYHLTKQIELSDAVHVLAAQPDGTLYRYDDGVWTPTGEQLLREIGHRALAATYGSNTHAELCEQIRATRPVPRTELGAPPGTVAVENGLLTLETREITNLTPSDYALTRLPVAYDPDASVPRWEQFIKEAVEPSRRDAIQEYVGYCLLIGELPIHRALMLVGEGSNGKSTFLRVVKALLGEENITAHPLQGLSDSEHNVADLYGAVANMCADLSPKAIGDGGMFKTLVGGDTVTGRRLYQEPFSFEATAKQLYSANQVPDVKIDDEAFFRRWLLVEFPTQFTDPDTPGPDKDPDLTDALLEELPGILNWALEGYERLIDQGHFTNEGDPLDKRDRWLSWGDSLSRFIDECVDTTADGKWRTSDVHARYAAWCRETLGEEPEAQQTLTKELKTCEGVQYGNYRFDGSRDRGLKGFDLADDVPAAHDATDETDPHQTALPQNQAIDTILTTVRELEADRGGPVPLADVVAEVGMDEDRALCYLDKLLTEGELYEPRHAEVAMP